jgi:SAM-dependent methyltransferase
MATRVTDREPMSRPATLPFVITIFVGSFLLFLVQPMVARMALPRLGGAPSVWNSAMLVYQALLLAGYAYAHWLGRLALRRQAALHLALFALAALALPIGLIAAEPSPDANPFLWMPWLLVVSIGPLFFVISAQAPLIQRWFASASTRDPYPLYAASNFGSFAGLLAYPLVVEPLLPIRDQRWVWSAGYVALALLVAWCALKLPKRDTALPSERADAPPPGWRERAYWIVLAAVPSGLTLSTTLHLTTDIAAMPLLWVIPLGLYLLSFTVAFASSRGPARITARAAPVILIAAACAFGFDSNGRELLFAIIALLNLFAVSVALHSQLFARRPDAAHLTLFYLMMSVGGVLGGIFCALVAPLVFDWTYEHPLLLAAAALLMIVPSPFERIARIWDGSRASRTIGLVAIPMVLVLAVAAKLSGSATLASTAIFAIFGIALFAIGNPPLLAICLIAMLITAGGWERLALSTKPGALTRSYFGIYSVRPSGDDARMLTHGTTVHGIQLLGSPERERTETTYYAPLSGVGLAMQSAPQLFGPAARVDLVGLGAGTLACYARPGQRWTIYEIDPAVAAIARNPAQFTFLSTCLPRVPIVIGDARLNLARAQAADADILVVDAFSSDAIPVHLLTREAFAVYARRLAPNGLLLVHITNRFLDLEPVVAANAAAGGWAARKRWYTPDAAARLRHETTSIWIALSRDPATLDRLAAAHPGWAPLAPRSGVAPWTDDHAAILPLIAWKS